MDRLRLISFSTPPALAVALHDGWLEREEIAVDLTRAPSSERQISGLLAGEWDVAHTAVDNVFAHVDGSGADLALVLVGEIGTDVRLVGRQAGEIGRLAGKRLGVDSPRSGYALMAYAILGRHGLDRSRYEVVEVGGSAQRAKELVAGSIDLAMLGAPYDEEAIAAGCRVLADAASYFPGYPALTVAVARTWAAGHRDLLRRYLRALAGAIRWSADPGNAEGTIAAIAAALGGNDRLARRLWERSARTREGSAPPSVPEMRAAAARALEVRRAVTSMGEPDAIDRYIDLSFAEEALMGRA
jgi:ABC-type nitrate/sulfonate/bicarbonate transport system substrate-binding protein